MGLGRENATLVDAEVVGGKLQAEPGGVATGEAVARPVPGGLDAEELASAGHLARRLRPPICEMWMRMKSISRPAISGQVLLLGVEQLAHGDRRARLLADRRKCPCPRAKRVFQEEQVVLLQLLAQADRLARRHPLVDVVEQLDLVAELRPQVVEQFGDVRR